MFAVISYKGNQYKVEPNKQYKIDLLNLASDQKEIKFSDIILLNDDKQTYVGAPLISGATVNAEIVDNIKDKKIRVFKFRAKKRYKREANHRQNLTVIKVTGINQNEK